MHWITFHARSLMVAAASGYLAFIDLMGSNWELNAHFFYAIGVMILAISDIALKDLED